MTLQRSIIGVLLTASLLAPTAAFAINSDSQFRDCMRDVMNNRENRIADASFNYQVDWQNFVNERRSRLFDSWDISNDGDRSRIQSDILTDIRKRLRDRLKSYNSDLRIFDSDFRNDQTRCKNELRDRDRSR